jgi:pyruvate kinase
LRRTKIIATLGPASADPLVLARMARAGMDVARINFSHGTYDDHRRAMRAVRLASHRARRTVGILLDLQGPRLRVGSFPGGSVRVAAGGEVLLTSERRMGSAGRIPRKRYATASSPLEGRVGSS